MKRILNSWMLWLSVVLSIAFLSSCTNVQRESKESVSSAVTLYTAKDGHQYILVEGIYSAAITHAEGCIHELHKPI